LLKLFSQLVEVIINHLFALSTVKSKLIEKLLRSSLAPWDNLLKRCPVDDLNSSPDVILIASIKLK